MLERESKITVLEEPSQNTYPCVTFHFYGEEGALFGLGEATEELVKCQIDIWYRVRTDAVAQTVKNIKTAVKKEKYCSYPKKGYIFEQGNRIHHTYFTFELIQGSEE